MIGKRVYGAACAGCPRPAGSSVSSPACSGDRLTPEGPSASAEEALSSANVTIHAPRRERRQGRHRFGHPHRAAVRPHVGSPRRRQGAAGRSPRPDGKSSRHRYARSDVGLDGVQLPQVAPAQARRRRHLPRQADQPPRTRSSPTAKSSVTADRSRACSQRRRQLVSADRREGEQGADVPARLRHRHPEQRDAGHPAPAQSSTTPANHRSRQQPRRARRKLYIARTDGIVK